MPLIVVNLGKVAVRRHVIEEIQRLTTALKAVVEFGVGLREESGIQVGASEVEPADPSIELLVGVVQQLNGMTRILLRQGHFTLNQFGIDRSLELRFGSETLGQFLCLRGFAGRGKNAPRREPG